MNKVVINNYTIHLNQELGSGNFATVYKAVDKKTGQIYAAKLLSKIQSTTFPYPSLNGRAAKGVLRRIACSHADQIRTHRSIRIDVRGQ